MLLVAVQVWPALRGRVWQGRTAPKVPAGLIRSYAPWDTTVARQRTTRTPVPTEPTPTPQDAQRSMSADCAHQDSTVMALRWLTPTDSVTKVTSPVIPNSFSQSLLKVLFLAFGIVGEPCSRREDDKSTFPVFKVFLA